MTGAPLPRRGATHVGRPHHLRRALSVRPGREEASAGVGQAPACLVARDHHAVGHPVEGAVAHAGQVDTHGDQLRLYAPGPPTARRRQYRREAPSTAPIPSGAFDARPLVLQLKRLALQQQHPEHVRVNEARKQGENETSLEEEEEHRASRKPQRARVARSLPRRPLPALGSAPDIDVAGFVVHARAVVAV